MGPGPADERPEPDPLAPHPILAERRNLAKIARRVAAACGEAVNVHSLRVFDDT